MNDHLIAIYDFEFFPYALGDVLTWNMRTTMRAIEANKSGVDIYICLDKKYPASIYQQGLINADNFELFFNELYGAFGTHPKLANLYIFRQRTDLLKNLQALALRTDKHNLEAINDYTAMLQTNNNPSLMRQLYNKLERRIRDTPVLKKIIPRLLPKQMQTAVRVNLSDEAKLNAYFIKYIYSHQCINAFAKDHGYVPFLQASLGCGPDVDELIGRCFKGKKIVPFHLRLRRLDLGYGGEHTYARDSDFLEWYDFLKTASIKYPHIQFIVLGRIQEKPLEILSLANVSSLRLYGLGLGHELTLMLRSDLFIGTSSGFAALANFSAIPYFITKMNMGSCQAYDIAYGVKQLPFAKDKQLLVYEEETSTLLMSLLEKGLSLPKPCNPQDTSSDAIAIASHKLDVSQWLSSRNKAINTSRTTARFYKDEIYSKEETLYLLMPYVEKAQKAYQQNDLAQALAILTKIKKNFSQLCTEFPEYLSLAKSLTNAEGDCFL